MYAHRMVLNLYIINKTLIEHVIIGMKVFRIIEGNIEGVRTEDDQEHNL